MEYLIREFEERDIQKLVQLCERHARYEGASYDCTNKEKLLLNALTSATPPLKCLIVEVRQQVIGYTTYGLNFSTWEAKYFLHMDCLYLDEGFRGFGIGNEIISRLKAQAKHLGCELLQWQTPTSNVDAIRFYNRLGAISLDKKRFFLNL